jgi:hypothetical protein
MNWNNFLSSLWTQLSYCWPHQHCNFELLLDEHEVDQRLETMLFSFLEFHLIVCVFGPKPCFPSWLLWFHQNIHVKFWMCPKGDDDMVTFLQSNNMNNILPSLLKNIMEHVAHSITFKWISNGRPFGRLKWMFFPNLCPYSCKKIIGISCMDPTTSSPSWWSDWKQRFHVSF